jgi:hypothetical protein
MNKQKLITIDWVKMHSCQSSKDSGSDVLKRLDPRITIIKKGKCRKLYNPGSALLDKIKQNKGL